MVKKAQMVEHLAGHMTLNSAEMSAAATAVGATATALAEGFNYSTQGKKVRSKKAGGVVAWIVKIFKPGWHLAKNPPTGTTKRAKRVSKILEGRLGINSTEPANQI